MSSLNNANLDQQDKTSWRKAKIAMAYMFAIVTLIFYIHTVQSKMEELAIVSKVNAQEIYSLKTKKAPIQEPQIFTSNKANKVN